MKVIDLSKPYRTTDAQLAAYLVARGHHPCRLEGPIFRRVFTFEGVPDELPSRYFEENETINPQRLFEAYRTVKRLLHQSA